MKKNLSVVIRIVLCIVAEFLLFWFKLPPINLRSKDFWSFVIESIILCTVIFAISSIVKFVKGINGKDAKELASEGKQVIKNSAKPVKVIIATVVLLIAFTIVGDIIGSKLFNAKSYSNLIEITEGDFAKDVAELKMSQIPVVDRDTATRLAQRELGNITDLVSQFEIDNEYTQINYKDHPYRVTPLRYAGFIKWLTNSGNGIPGYITIDLTTQEADLSFYPDDPYLDGLWAFENLGAYTHYYGSFPVSMP